MAKPHVIIFSSGKAIHIAEGVKLNLEHHYTTDIWTENFFDENNTPPLNTFLKKLLCFDIAVLVLGDDDLQLAPGNGAATAVPRDNVIFELGATMARMGTKKTFLLTPEEPKVKLPTYFKGLDPLPYAKRDDGNHVAGTGAACIQIRNRIESLDEDAFHSDLPALGLAYGYFYNFILPIHTTLREPQLLHLGESNSAWEPKHGFTLTVVIPDTLMNRQSIDELLVGETGTTNAHVLLKDGRDMSVYVLPRATESSPLHILDIPTTLLTSEKIIRRVDSFWGGGDRAFKEVLMRREISAFARRIRGLIIEEQLSKRRIHVVEISKLNEHITALSAA